MEVIQIVIISILAIIQLITFMFLVKHMTIPIGFVVLFLVSSVLIFNILIVTISANNDHQKQESICPQYEEIEDKVYRLK